MQQPYIIREVDWNDAKDLLLQVREKVFVCEQRVDPEIENDGKDPDCFHVLVTDVEGTPIGTGRMTKQGKIGRVAVLLPFRGSGLGSQILNKLIEIANRELINFIQLNAQVQAQDFYKRHRFVAKGPVFMEAGIPHQAMRREIPIHNV